jgi:hypothetical protein
MVQTPPKNCMHGLDPRFCGRCSPTPNQKTDRPKVSRKPRGSARPSLLAVRFSDDGRRLILEPDLATGWRFMQKTFGYCEEQRLSSLAHSDLRVQLLIYSPWRRKQDRPPLLIDGAGPPPESRQIFRIKDPDLREAGVPADPTNWELVSDTWSSPIRYLIHRGALAVDIDLLDATGRFNNELQWGLTSTGAPCSNLAVVVGGRPPADNGEQLDQTQPVVDWRVQVLLVARPPELRTGPVDREWLDKLFVPGGLPSLGKRR